MFSKVHFVPGVILGVAFGMAFIMSQVAWQTAWPNQRTSEQPLLSGIVFLAVCILVGLVIG